MDRVRITFELHPAVNADHWFGLTDGRYDLVVEERSPFRIVDGYAGGIAYFVARLWEDLVEVAPAAFESIPDELAERLVASERWSDWVERAYELEGDADLVDTALSWWNDRQLYTGPLQDAPRLHLWRTGNELSIRWRSHPDAPASRGDAVTTVDAFSDELVGLDRALIAAMHRRIEDLSARGFDTTDLRRDHEGRATLLVRTLLKHRPSSRWDAVLGAISTLEARLGTVFG